MEHLKNDFTHDGNDEAQSAQVMPMDDDAAGPAAGTPLPEVSVTVPAGSGAGAALAVATPDGQTVEVTASPRTAR